MQPKGTDSKLPADPGWVWLVPLVVELRASVVAACGWSFPVGTSPNSQSPSASSLLLKTLRPLPGTDVTNHSSTYLTAGQEKEVKVTDPLLASISLSIKWIDGKIRE